MHGLKQNGLNKGAAELRDGAIAEDLQPNNTTYSKLNQCLLDQLNSGNSTRRVFRYVASPCS
jgi:hypothetical protein